MRVQLQPTESPKVEFHSENWPVLVAFLISVAATLVPSTPHTLLPVAAVALGSAAIETLGFFRAWHRLGGCSAGGLFKPSCRRERWPSACRRLAAVMALVGAAILTLDLPDPQVLVHRPNDADGVPWHHIILLKRMQAGVWVGLNPRLGLENIDLNATDHIVLERLAAFPAEHADETLAHDPLPKATLEGHRRRAATTAAILGDPLKGL